MMIEWKKSDTFESSPCDPMKCNPKCPQCGDTPSCGDGSWSWGHGKHRHRCRDAHPQSGHDDVLCNTHDGPFIIDRLTRENADHAAELARVEKENALLRAECEAWRACKGFTDERMFWAAAWTYEDGKAVIAARAATDAAGILARAAVEGER